MILADGTLVTASETENPDLFWAIRGCGSAFGVAVEFTYKAYDQGPVWAGLMIFTPDKLGGVVDFANKFDKENDGNQGISFGFSAPPPANKTVLLAAVFCNGSAEAGEKFFGDLIALEPVVKQVGLMPYEQLNSILNGAAGAGGRKTGGASAVKCPLDPKFVQSIFDDFSSFVEGNAGVNESLILFELIPYQKIVEIPFEATSNGNRGEYYNVGTVFKWYDPVLDGLVRGYSKKLHQKVRAGGGTSAMKGVGAYSNYIGTDSFSSQPIVKASYLTSLT